MTVDGRLCEFDVVPVSRPWQFRWMVNGCFPAPIPKTAPAKSGRPRLFSKAAAWTKRRPARIRGEEELQGLAAGKVSIGLRTPTPDFQRVGINHRRGQAVAAPHECHIRLTEQPTQMDSEGRAGLLKAL